MILVGVTGQTGSGKTTFSNIFREIGAKVIDADKIGHKLHKNPEIKAALVEGFGEEILNDQGEISREILGELVFSSKAKRMRLDRIMHKEIIGEIKSQIIEVKKDGFPGVIVLDAALLPKWEELLPLFNFIVLVKAPKWQRINRLVETRDMTQDSAEQRIDILEDIYAGFHPNIDYDVTNSGNEHEFRAKIMKVWLHIKKRTSLGDFGDH